jgi:hypothetical protein
VQILQEFPGGDYTILGPAPIAILKKRNMAELPWLLLASLAVLNGKMGFDRLRSACIGGWGGRQIDHCILKI